MAFNVVDRVIDRVRVQNALVSVFDKRELDVLVEGLLDNCPGIRLYSTGGTHARLAELLRGRGSLHTMSEYTGRPEMQGGLVKTLDYRLYLGLLSEPFNPDHEADLERTGALRFDLTVVNLYPFEKATAGPDVDVETARGHIDIGGPAMLRASAKNFIRVGVVCDPGDYGSIVEELAANSGTLGLETRFRLARKAFERTAAYDSAIVEFLARAHDLPYTREKDHG